MAVITEKNTRRYRVQFTISRAIHQTYEASLERARKLGVVIDFTRDFEKFFANQLEQVARELQQLEGEQPQSNGAGATKVVQAPVVSVGNTTAEGGTDHA